ncbi:MAG: M13 family metallopeptidase [Polyangiaceae bacterium]|jgi:putative endopeptidase
MRRLSPIWSIPALSLAAACGASSQGTPAAAPSNPAPVTTVQSAFAPPPAHLPAPPLPTGIDAASIDPSVSPCNDFYQYACGGWTKANPIPSDQVAWETASVLDENNKELQKQILERDVASPPADQPYSKALGDFYGACMDEAAVEKDGLRGIAPELGRIAQVNDATSLSREVGRLHSIGVYPYFAVASEQDYKDATEMIAQVEQRGLGLPDRDYYLKDDARTVAMQQKYVAHVERVFTLLGDKPELAKKEAQAVFALERSLATDQMSRVDERDPAKVYHRMTPGELAKVAPTFKWDTYFKELGAPALKALNVHAPAYVATIDKLVAEANKAAWADQIRPYLRFTLERSYAESLPKAFVDEAFAFRKELTGQEKIDPRWRRCVRAVDRGMGEALAVPFVKEKFGEAGKQLAQTEVKGIEEAMEADLKQLSWMDETTRARALEKAHKVANMIGFPDHWRNYDALKIDRKSNVLNHMHSAAFEKHRDLAKIGKPVDRSEWDMTPPTVNAYYDPSMNEMVFPAGILQPPFFAVTRPAAANIGAIGSIMGHELTHGFDDEGRKFDGNGNMIDWWTDSVSADFDKRASCVADQFDSYVAVDDVHVNGKLTLGENLADLGGLKLALGLARKSAPAVAETDRQFFLSFAQAWCGDIRPELLRVITKVDPHSPAKWRVNGPLSNMSDFANAFSCRAGDAMVRPPEKQCSVW